MKKIYIILIILFGLFKIQTKSSSETIFFNNYGTIIDKLYIVNSDSVVTNQIESVWYSNTEIFIRIKVADKNKIINLTIYNMLGKEMVKVYEGPHTRGDEPYTLRYYLPNGIYICVLLGDNFKVAYKFILSR